MTLEPGLYVAATPIGNLKDITLRAIETMKNADLILCEDTRQTAKLCQAHGIQTHREAYHDHNGARARPAILEKLENGGIICLVSDAGTPLISDPGFKLVAEARSRDIPVIALPGPCAAIAALSIAGLPSDRFMFAGFPPVKKGARQRFFDSIASIEATLVFYEGTSRIQGSLADMANIFGNRQVRIARELTKKFEEIVSGTLDDVQAINDKLTVKGEFVILLGPPEAAVYSDAMIDGLLQKALTEMSVKEAAGDVATKLGIPRRDAYTRAQKLKDAVKTQPKPNQGT